MLMPLKEALVKTLLLRQPGLCSRDSCKMKAIGDIDDIAPLASGIGHYSIKRLEHLRSNMGVRLDDFE